MKKYKAIFFDLDGTLLPMSLDEYIKDYFASIKEKLAKENYDGTLITEAISKGLYLMIKNQGEKSNEKVFWEGFFSVYNVDKEKIEKVFLDYYENEYNVLARNIPKYEKANEVIKSLKSKGYLLVCATNPLYPQIATSKRLVWAGIDSQNFDYITSYEDNYYSKPNVKYFEEILKKFSLKAEEVLMVGNDAVEDLVFKKINGDAYLVTDYLLHRENSDIIPDYEGTFEEFVRFALEKL